MLVARTVADLDEAQPVAQRVEAHRLGIDRDGARPQRALGQVLFVEIDSHGLALGRNSVPLNDWFQSRPPRRGRCGQTCKIPHGAFEFSVRRSATNRLYITPLAARGESVPMVNCVPVRSEEHTSELQSLMRISYDVFCFKKKNKHKNQQQN